MATKKAQWHFFNMTHDCADYIICDKCGYAKNCSTLETVPNDEGKTVMNIVRGEAPNYCEHCGCKMTLGEDIKEKWDPENNKWIEDKKDDDKSTNS